MGPAILPFFAHLFLTVQFKAKKHLKHASWDIKGLKKNKLNHEPVVQAYDEAGIGYRTPFE